MKSTIEKWGSGLVVRLPKRLAKEAEFSAGQTVELQALRLGCIEIRSQKSRPTLKQLVARITPENQHCETDWGKAVGKEF